MTSIGVIFTSTYHIKQLNLCPNSSANHVANYSWVFGCHVEMEPFKEQLSTRGHLTSLSKSSLGNFQHHYLAELLVNVYSHC